MYSKPEGKGLSTLLVRGLAASPERTKSRKIWGFVKFIPWMKYLLIKIQNQREKKQLYLDMPSVVVSAPSCSSSSRNVVTYCKLQHVTYSVYANSQISIINNNRTRKVSVSTISTENIIVSYL